MLEALVPLTVLVRMQSVKTSSKPPLPYGHELVSGGLRMFTMPYGPKWRTYRTIVHQLVSTKMTMTFIPSQEYEVTQLLADLLDSNSDQCAFYGHVRRMSISILSTSTLGRRIPTANHADIKRARESSKLLGRITRAGVFVEDEVPPLLRLPVWLQPSYKKAKEYSKVLLDAKLHIWNRLQVEAKNGKCIPCFGRTLVESNFREQGLVEADAAWIVGGLVEAGSETTSVTLLNAILHLAAYPAAQAAAAAEVAAVVPPSRAPCFADLSSLPHVRAIVKEVLRLRPVPVFGLKHFADEDVTYKQHSIPAGTVLLANPTAIHFDESRWEKPFEFRPERYLAYDRSSADYASAADPLARDHFTFGAGRRICPGVRLAENTLELAVAGILWGFDIRPPLLNGAGKEPTEGIVDVGVNAFERTAFAGPKPFAVRFVPRSTEAANVIRQNWARKSEEGYELRGFTVKDEKA